MSAEAMAMLGQATQGGANPIEQFMPLVSEVYNWFKIKEQRRYNESQIDKQWQRQLDQWNRENTYNDPRQVIARMRDAGVNPALAYMNGASFAPAASSPSAGANHGQPIPIDPLTAANVELAHAQAENLRAQTKTEDELRGGRVENLSRQNVHLEQMVRTMTADEKLKYANISRLAVQNDLDTKQLNGMLDLWNSEIMKNRADMHLTEETLNQLIYFRELKAQNLDLQNKQILASIGLTHAQVQHLSTLDNQIDKQLESDYSPAMVQFREDLLNAQADMADAQAYYWDDYTDNPGKYMTFTESHSWKGPFGIGGSSSYQDNYVPYRQLRHGYNQIRRSKRRNSNRNN